jgi:penicillin amidase
VQGVPSLRYFAHLSAPGLEVVGAGEPFLPGISLGHNRTIAFGLTIFAIDQEDLYVYETNPSDPDEYRYRGRWEPMTLRTESVAVRGSEPRHFTLKFTRHGPVIFEDPVKHRAYAARVAWLEPGGVPYLSSLEYQRAQNWDEFLAGMNRHGMPSLNYLYADTAGNIGWAPSGFAPIRPNWDGLLPVPGDGRYEWAGLRTMDELPRVYNPAAGWLGTSNEMNLPATPEVTALNLGFEWADAARAMRQKQIFGGTRTFSVQDVIAAQTDITSVMGQRATALLGDIPAPAERAVATAWEALRKWDHRAARDSVGAAIYNVWFHQHVRPAVIQRVVPAAAAKHIGLGSAAAVIDLLEKPDNRLGANPVQSRNEILLSALRSAVDDLTQRLGSDQSQWRWGRLHTALFEHPLASLAPEAMRSQWNIGPVSKAGDGQTLGVSTWHTDDFRLTAGASARFVTDVGDWQNTWATNSPGQSGDPRSRHYRDLFEDWAYDRYFPLVFDRAAVENATEERIVLVSDNP